jgi:hypothetical protein
MRHCKDFLSARGSSAKLYGSRDATRAAFAAELLQDGEAWMKMIEHRNESSHTYNDDVAGLIMAAVALVVAEIGRHPAGTGQLRHVAVEAHAGDTFQFEGDVFGLNFGDGMG